MNTPYLKCIQTGLTHGSQTVARAELIALTEACQHAVDSPSCCSAEFIVDAQYILYIYIINVINLVQMEKIHGIKSKIVMSCRNFGAYGNKKTSL